MTRVIAAVILAKYLDRLLAELRSRVGRSSAFGTSAIIRYYL